jgi:hypothetical protein
MILAHLSLMHLRGGLYGCIIASILRAITQIQLSLTYPVVLHSTVPLLTPHFKTLFESPIWSPPYTWIGTQWTDPVSIASAVAIGIPPYHTIPSIHIPCPIHYHLVMFFLMSIGIDVSKLNGMLGFNSRWTQTDAVASLSQRLIAQYGANFFAGGMALRDVTFIILMHCIPSMNYQ